MFVCIELSEDYDSWNDVTTKYVDNVYGPFDTLEEAEEFRSKHTHPEDCDCFLLQAPDQKVLDKP